MRLSGGDERREDDYAGVEKKRRDFGHPSHLFVSVGILKPEVHAQSGTDTIAIQDNHLAALLMQPSFHFECERGLAGSGQPCQPDDATPMTVASFPVGPLDPGVTRFPARHRDVSLCPGFHLAAKSSSRAHSSQSIEVVAARNPGVNVSERG